MIDSHELQAAELTDQERLEWCLNNLGQSLTTIAVGDNDAAEVRGWAEQTDPLTDETSRKVKALHAAATSVAAVYGAQTARSFLRSSNPEMGDEAIIIAIRESEPDTASKVEANIKLAVTAFVD